LRSLAVLNQRKNFDEAFILQVRNENDDLLAGIAFRMENVIPVIGRFFKFCRADSSVVVDQTLANEEEEKELKKFAYLALIKHLKRRKVVFLYISPMTRSYDVELLNDIGFENDKCATFMIDLSQDEDLIYQSFSKKNRYKIRNAIKNGVEVVFYEGESAIAKLPEYMELQKKLFEAKRESYSKLYYKYESFLNKIFYTKYSKAYLAIVYAKKKPAAATIFTVYKNLAFNYIGATDSKLSAESNASNLMLFEIIKFVKNIGCEYNDLGGIPYNTDESIETHGVYFFKRSFGGTRYEFDIGNIVVRKFSYNIIWKLHRNQYHPIIRFFLNFFRGPNKK